jgi:GT2 family glycosyltransferase
MNNNVAVVLLNWNGKNFLQKFLPSVIENSDNASIYVADNGSEDGSVDFLKQNFPSINIICFEKNYGFAKGYNMALQQIEAEYFVLLNSDVEVTPNWISPIITFLDSKEDYVACQPKILSYYDRSYFEYSGGAGGFIDRYGYPFCRGRLFDTLEKDNGQYDEDCEIFWATGACLFVRAQVFHEFGGFDEDFFAHMEEIDLCWRFKNAGYKIGYCHSSVIYHVGGGSLPKSSPYKTYLNIRNNEVMLIKNLYKPSFHIIIFRFIL